MAKSRSNLIIVALGAIAVGVGIVIIILQIVMSFLSNSDNSTSVEDKGMTITRFDSEIAWHSDRTARITQTITTRFNERSHGIYIDIPVNSGERVRELSVTTSPDVPCSLEHESGNKLVRAVVGDPDRYFYSGSTLKCKVTYDYITPVHKSDADILAIMAIGTGWTCYVEYSTIKVTYPEAPLSYKGDYGVWVAGKKLSDSALKWSNDGKTLSLISGALPAYKGVEVAVIMPDGVLTPYRDTEFLVTLIVGAVLIVAAVILELFIAKNKPLTPIVDFYPPRINGTDGAKRHMLPVQMGKIIDNSCSNEDVTSLIFYWASKGYINIIEDEKQNITLKKISDLSAITNYEKKMFDKLFSYADADGNVELSALRGKFSDTVLSTRSAVNNEYRGKFYDKKFTIVSVVMSVLCGVYGIAVALLTSLRIGWGFINIIGFVSIVPVLITAVLGRAIAQFFFKLEQSKRRLLVAGYTVLSLLMAFVVAVLIPQDVMGWAEKIIFAVCLSVPSAISPFLIVRTSYYNEQLNSILGFKNFLRDAEKERLETLLADDPQYYYNILPYANVLGVSQIWQDKFKDITVEPPSYYYGSGRVSVFDILVLNHIMRSMSSNMMYVVPKSNGGSFSGGGFGGGGFSGGSFGGGGGGRW